jgi:two-component system, NtrC family, sensor kinase
MKAAEEESGNDTGLPPARVRLSVRFRVLVGLIAIMAIFSFLTIYSIVLHKQTVEKVALINTAYLPLILGTFEISANQVVFNIFMDRLPDSPNQSVTREWIDAARRFRPYTLNKLIEQIDASPSATVPAEESAFLAEMRQRLQEVGRRYETNESRFVNLYALMDSGRIEQARKNIESLKRVERHLNRALAGIGQDIGEHIKEIAEDAEYNGTQATLWLALLTIVGLSVAVVLIISTNTLLVPLKRLQEGVGKVAGGDLLVHIQVARQNEIGALAEGFNRMTDALRERDQLLIRSEQLAGAGKMAAKVTHEIRNPLSSLGLNAELLDDELAGQPELEEARALLSAMQDEIERLTQITESYLRYSRLPAPSPKRDDIRQVVSSILDFMKEEFKERQIEVKTVYADDLGLVFFDRGQIRQALSNLIKNALDAMSEGGTLTVETRKNDDFVEIAVSDTGCGIPAESADQVFKSFFSTKSTGTGLGLPLVRQICIAHGGDARLEETSPAGSTFVLSVPVTSRSLSEVKT